MGDVGAASIVSDFAKRRNTTVRAKTPFVDASLDVPCDLRVNGFEVGTIKVHNKSEVCLKDVKCTVSVNEEAAGYEVTLFPTRGDRVDGDTLLVTIPSLRPNQTTSRCFSYKFKKRAGHYRDLPKFQANFILHVTVDVTRVEDEDAVEVMVHGC